MTKIKDDEAETVENTALPMETRALHITTELRKFESLLEEYTQI